MAEEFDITPEETEAPSRKRGKKSEAVVLPDPEIPEPGIESTAKTYEGDGLVYARQKDSGAVVRVTPEEYSNSPNLAPVTQGDAEDYDNFRRIKTKLDTGLLSYLNAGVQGAREASMGGLDLAATSLLPNRYAAAYRQGVGMLEELHPYSSGIGRLTGAIAPIAAGGVGGLAGMAAKATPVALADIVGARAGAAVARGLGGAGVASTATRVGTEAALWGSAHAAADLAMHDRPITGEAIMSGFGSGLMYGGLMGAGFGSLLKIGGAAKGMASRVARQTTGEATNPAEAVALKYGDAAHPTHMDLAASAAQQGKISPENIRIFKVDERYRKMLLEDEQRIVRARKAGEITHALNLNDDVLNEYMLAAGGQKKHKQWSALFETTEARIDDKFVDKSRSPVNVLKTEERVVEKLNEVREDLAALFTEGKGGAVIDPAGLREVERVNGYIASKLEDLNVSKLMMQEKQITPRAHLANMAMAMDDVKRYVQAYGSKHPVPKSWEAVTTYIAREGIPQQPGTLAHMMERQSLWGQKAAKTNAEINRLVYEQLERKRVLADLKSLSGEVDDRFPYLSGIRKFDEAKIAGFLDTLDDPINDQYVRTLREYMNANAELATKMAGFYDLPEGTLARLGGMEKAAKFIDAELDVTTRGSAADLFTFINQARRVGAGNPQAWTRIFGFALGGALVGGKIGALAGGFIGSRLASMLNPTASGVAMAVAERAIKNHNDWKLRWLRKMLGMKLSSEAAAEAAVDAAKVAAKPATASQRAKALFKQSAPMKALLYEAFREATDDDTTAYQRHIELLRQAASSPAHVEGGLRTTLGEEFAAAMPNATKAMAARIAAGAALLLTKAPLADRSGTVGGWGSLPPNPHEMRQFEDLFEAWVDPESALDRAIDGELSPAVVEVLDIMVPEQMAALRQEILAGLQQMETPPPRSRRIQLSVVLGAPVDEGMSPGYLSLMAEIHTAQDKVEQEQSSTYRNRRTYGRDGERRSYATGVDRREAGEYPR